MDCANLCIPIRASVFYAAIVTILCGLINYIPTNQADCNALGLGFLYRRYGIIGQNEKCDTRKRAYRRRGKNKHDNTDFAIFHCLSSPFLNFSNLKFAKRYFLKKKKKKQAIFRFFA
jgi:hypothetical protein